MLNNLKIPSRTHEIIFPAFRQASVRVFIKREDEIHRAISGNKWRKLKYNLEAIKAANQNGFITFGGAFSNHIAAAAYAGYLAKMQMVGVIRGEDVDDKNQTLAFARKCGMQLHFVSRSEYAQKNTADFLQKICAQHSGLAVVPEGGANILGVKGCTEIWDEDDNEIDMVACPIGTATTFSGLVLSVPKNVALMGFTALKGGNYLRDDVHNFVQQAINGKLVPSTFSPPLWELEVNNHFGGFGKVKPELIGFMNDFYDKTGVPLDPVYTAKMMFGLAEKANNGAFKKGTRILAIHTGGLQGIKGMNKRLKNKNYKIEYEKIIADTFSFTGN